MKVLIFFQRKIQIADNLFMKARKMSKIVPKCEQKSKKINISVEFLKQMSGENFTNKQTMSL